MQAGGAGQELQQERSVVKKKPAALHSVVDSGWRSWKAWKRNHLYSNYTVGYRKALRKKNRRP